MPDEERVDSSMEMLGAVLVFSIVVSAVSLLALAITFWGS